MKKEFVPQPASHHREGSAAISAAFATLPMPATKEQAIARVGEWKIPYDKERNRSVPLRELIETLPVERFDDPGQAAQLVDRQWGRIAGALRDIPEDEP